MCSCFAVLLFSRFVHFIAIVTTIPISYNCILQYWGPSWLTMPCKCCLWLAKNFAFGCLVCLRAALPNTLEECRLCSYFSFNACVSVLFIYFLFNALVFSVVYSWFNDLLNFFNNKHACCDFHVYR